MSANEPLDDVGTHVVVDALRRIDGLKGVFCFGSYAMSSFDADSDVDLYVLWHPEIPSSEERRSAFQQIKGIEDLDIGHIEPGWAAEEWFPQCDRFRLQGVLFDLGHNTEDWLTSAVRKAREFPKERDGRRYLNVLGLLANSMSLHDPDAYLADLKSQIHPFPADLKEAMVSENMINLKSSLEGLRDSTRRGIGNTAFQFHLMRAVQAIGAALFAVNDMYNPMTKRVEEALKKLPLKPRRFLERYMALLSTALDEERRLKTTRDLALLTQDLEHLIGGRAEPSARPDDCR